VLFVVVKLWDMSSPILLRLHELTSKDSHLKLLSFDAFIGCPAAPTSEASSSSSSCCDIITEEKGRFNTSLNSSLSLYGGGSYYFEYADIWEDAYQGQPVGESRVLHGGWKLDESNHLSLEGELYIKSTHVGGAVEEKVEEHKSILIEILPDGDLKLVAAKSNFKPFGDGVVLHRAEVVTASSHEAVDEAAGKRLHELASPHGKRIAQEKKIAVRSFSLEKLQKKRIENRPAIEKEPICNTNYSQV